MNPFQLGQDYDFRAGELLLVDKPMGWTSFDVVNKLRYRLKYITGVKRFKVGHAGTLDPLATGLLLICTGKFTKRLHELQGLPKEYTGTIQLGATTPSYDMETEVDQNFPTDHITMDLIQEKREAFIGAIEQMPPIYSAIKIDGERAYKNARAGKEIKMKSRPVTIHDFELSNFQNNQVDFRVAVSKGTYIRSLAFDFGKAVGSGGYLAKLVRTKVADYRIEDAWNLEELMEFLNGLEDAGGWIK